MSEDKNLDRKIPTTILAIRVANEIRVLDKPRLRLRFISMPTNRAHIKNTEIENSAYVIV
jgi:hypothetical protein